MATAHLNTVSLAARADAATNPPYACPQIAI